MSTSDNQLGENHPDERPGPTDLPGRAVTGRHRVRRYVLTGVAGAVIVGGGGAYAFASGDGGATGTPTAPTSGAPAAPAGGAAPSAPAPPANAPKPGPHIDGTVSKSDGSTVTVKDPDGFTRTINTSSATKYNGVSAPLASGTKIHATGTVDSDGTSLDATAISAMPEPGKGGPPAPPTPPTSGSKEGAPTTPSRGPGTGSTGDAKDAPSAPNGGPSAPTSEAPSASSSTGS